MQRAPFRVPLHAEGEGVFGNAYRLNQPVVGARFNKHAGSDLADPLLMQRVHANGLTWRDPAVEPAAGRDFKPVDRREFRLRAAVRVDLMLAQPLDVMQLPPELAARRDHHLMHAAARAEQRQAGVKRMAHQHQRQLVASRIVARFLRLFAVMVRLDIARAAGEKNAAQRF